jgi:hypothetical protein
MSKTVKSQPDFTKKYNNGHKSFGAQEAAAYSQLLQTELHAEQKFLAAKGTMTYPRNPLNGDVTPRDVNGNRVSNPNHFDKICNGVLLFDVSGGGVDYSNSTCAVAF